MAYIVPSELPTCCADCFFHTSYEDISVGNGLYKKISRCIFAPERIEDPWRNVTWMIENKEEWCPIKK